MFIKRSGHRPQRGLTLIELIVFIVIVGIALVGVLSVLNMTNQHSADPLIRKQMLSIAEALLEEVEMQPFTFCDPDDPQAALATNALAYNVTTNPHGCNITQGIGPTTVEGEARGDATYPFDNVGDYAGLSLSSPIPDINGYNTNSPPGYSATIDVSPAALGTVADALRITVTVKFATTNDSLTLEGYRTRYAPNTCPTCV